MFSIASAWAWTQTIGGVLLILLALLVIVDKFLELRKKKVKPWKRMHCACRSYREGPWSSSRDLFRTTCICNSPR